MKYVKNHFFFSIYSEIRRNCWYFICKIWQNMKYSGTEKTKVLNIITDRDICGFVLSRLSRRAKATGKAITIWHTFHAKKKKDWTANLWREISCKSESKKYPSWSFSKSSFYNFTNFIIHTIYSSLIHTCFISWSYSNPVRRN